MTGEPAAVVPPGERADLQKTAQETGVWMGSTDSQLGEHARHLERINGSMTDVATAMGQQATAMALMAAGIRGIEGKLTDGTTEVHRKQGISTQWALVIFTAVISSIGLFATTAISVVVLIASGKL